MKRLLMNLKEKVKKLKESRKKKVSKKQDLSTLDRDIERVSLCDKRGLKVLYEWESENRYFKVSNVKEPRKKKVEEEEKTSE